MAIWVIFIISLVVSTIIVNKAMQFYMKIIGADAMFFSGKKKIIAIVVIGILLTAIAVHIFGIDIPS